MSLKRRHQQKSLIKNNFSHIAIQKQHLQNYQFATLLVSRKNLKVLQAKVQVQLQVNCITQIEVNKWKQQNSYQTRNLSLQQALQNGKIKAHMKQVALKSMKQVALKIAKKRTTKVHKFLKKLQKMLLKEFHCCRMLSKKVNTTLLKRTLKKQFHR